MSDHESVQLPVHFLDAQEDIPRLVSALGQDDAHIHLMAIRPRVLDDGLVAMVFRLEADRRENQCEALYGSMFSPGVLDTPGNDARAADVWEDFYFQQRMAERDKPSKPSLPGRWEGSFEPEGRPTRLVLWRELEPDRRVWILEAASGWDVGEGPARERLEHSARAAGLREAFEQAVELARRLLGQEERLRAVSPGPKEGHPPARRLRRW